jgi:hypothetical protein
MQQQQRRQLGGSSALASAAVRQRQCVISTVAVGSSAVAMFPLFITHDEYFVRCGGNGGEYYNVLDLSSYELLSGQKSRNVRPTYKHCTPVWVRGY